MAKTDTSTFEQKLFKSADKLRKNIDAAEYKHVVLGLIFLKYISESFSEKYEELNKDEYSDPEDRDEYIAANIFFVPKEARWSHIHANAKLPTIGQTIDEAMEAIERENKELKNVLPQVYGKANLDKTSLGELIDLISNTDLQVENNNSKDLFGRVYEYFLGEFANAEGKKGGQFYTPKAIVKLMVEMIEPYKGRVYDPASGSGGMFVMSEKFVLEHRGRINDITVYGQESNQTTWKLSKMNLAIRNINSKFVAWNSEGSFLKDAHPDLKADFILANPPFKGSLDAESVSGDLLKVCKTKKTELLFLTLFLRILKIGGRCACIVPDGVLFGSSKAHKDIRTEIVENQRLEAVISMPSGVFKPYAGVSTAILVFTKTEHGGTDNVWFYDMKADGFSLDDKRAVVSENDITDIIKRFKNREQEIDRKRTEQSFMVPKQEIVDNGYDLSINKYKQVEYEKIEYPATSEILANIKALDKEIAKEMEELELLLGQQ